jgi:hypothetical protein
MATALRIPDRVYVIEKAPTYTAGHLAAGRWAPDSPEIRVTVARTVLAVRQRGNSVSL